MRRIVLVIFLLIAWINFACQGAFLMQNREMANKQPTPTVAPSKKIFNKQEFDEHYGRGTTIWATGKIPDDLPKAIEEFKKAAEIDPKDTTSYWWMIKLYTILKEYNEVEVCYRKIMERDLQDLRAQWGLAYVLVWDLGRYEEGLKEALIAKEKKATYSWAIEETIGKAYEGLGDIPTAIKHYKIYLRDLNSPGSTIYKDMKKKIAELEKANQNTNSNR